MQKEEEKAAPHDLKITELNEEKEQLSETLKVQQSSLTTATDCLEKLLQKEKEEKEKRDQTLSFAEIMRQQQRDRNTVKVVSQEEQNLRIEIENTTGEIKFIEKRLQEINAETLRLDYLNHVAKMYEKRPEFDYHITTFGEMVMMLPMSFSHSKFVLFGAQFNDLVVHFAVMYIRHKGVWLCACEVLKFWASDEENVANIGKGGRP